MTNTGQRLMEGTQLEEEEEEEDKKR